MRVACAPTTAVKFVNMAADLCMVFKVFDLLLLSFLHKNTSEDLKKFKSAQARYGRQRFLLFQKCFAICLGLLFTIGGLIASRLTLSSLTL